MNARHLSPVTPPERDPLCIRCGTAVAPAAFYCLRCGLRVGKALPPLGGPFLRLLVVTHSLAALAGGAVCRIVTWM